MAFHVRFRGQSGRNQQESEHQSNLRNWCHDPLGSVACITSIALMIFRHVAVPVHVEFGRSIQANIVDHGEN